MVPYFSNGVGIFTGLSDYPPALELHFNSPPTPPSPPAMPRPPPYAPGKNPQPPPPPSPISMLEFNSATASTDGGCESTYIRSDNPTTNYAHETGHWWDGQSSHGHRDYVLVQFTDIFGHADHQIHPHDMIAKASLNYYVDLSYSGNAVGAEASVHEVKNKWSGGSVTWNSFAGERGLTTEEYDGDRVGEADARTQGWKEVDVTGSIQKWLDETNP
jgi:hypothetical protein